MKWLRSILVFFAAAVTVWLLLCVAIGIVATEGALHPGRLPLSAQDEQRAVAIAAEVRARLKDVQITAGDGAVLRAWSIQLPGGNGDAVILLHGVADNRAGMLGVAEMLLQHGYSVLLPDARAHGASGGGIGTYGILEADDVRRWFEWLRGEDSPGCINGIGDSMGGAELLRSLVVERGFCAVIAESPFATFREAAYDRLGQQFSAGPWLGRTLLRPALAVATGYARVRYGIDLRRADPAGAVAATRVPVLLIHGLTDSNLPPRHSEMIRAKNPAVVLWEPAGAGHCGAFGSAPAEYERWVLTWLQGHDSH